ncbi:OsmC family protein [Actinokineospora bangkokensis]|uniref:Peroxiredoxin n=1 Tax=Actinokineospora bangkokensis TaxID=1193682 RepID=A0A1Q9LM12_9PSEU|nr:OsmC family protein [Actinokineospora bangkokensis]OLR93033.1 peroxiredoxin [Actinokineospora bangkokensis]
MEHDYAVTVTWTDRGPGTTSYRAYDRGHDISAAGKPTIAGSADPHFRGDPARWNPEELLVASLSQCHMLSYLALCAGAGITVTAYRDEATGTMLQRGSGGRFTGVTLRPRVTVADPAAVDAATALHDEAHAICFIASSVDFPVHHEPEVRAA